VLVPFSENQRYDLVIDEGDELIRVQCKTGRLRQGAVRFATCSMRYHHPNNQGTRNYRHSYEGQADLFGIYCPEIDSVYLVPVASVGKVMGYLRVHPTKNNQTKKVRWAHDYELKLPG
jgi:hypothetical protein